jgi:uncharacterized protein (DUF2141 family)
MRIKFLSLILVLLSFSFDTPLILTIEISELKNSNGLVLLEVQDEKKNFIKGVSQEIVNNQCIIKIDNLSPGKYAFKYFHDENSNEKLDANWIGIPKEGFGFSNNAKGTFGSPSHKKTIFELTADTTLNCTPIYLK